MKYNAIFIFLILSYFSGMAIAMETAKRAPESAALNEFEEDLAFFESNYARHYGLDQVYRGRLSDFFEKRRGAWIWDKLEKARTVWNEIKNKYTSYPSLDFSGDMSYISDPEEVTAAVALYINYFGLKVGSIDFSVSPQAKTKLTNLPKAIAKIDCCYLSFKNHQLSSLPPEMKDMKNLAELDLQGNPFKAIPHLEGVKIFFDQIPENQVLETTDEENLPYELPEHET